MPSFDSLVIETDRVPDSVLSNIEGRDVVLWVRTIPSDPLIRTAVRALFGLPWRSIFSEGYDHDLFSTLDEASTLHSSMVRRRGFVQLIDNDPTQIPLPQRCLPIYLLNGRNNEAMNDFQSRLRRMTMLAALSRSAPRQLVILGDEADPVPGDLKDLWSSGFRCSTVFVSDKINAFELVNSWLSQPGENFYATFVRESLNASVLDITERYFATYPEDRQVVRMRTASGDISRVDLTEVDDPERPLVESYSLIQERDLAVIAPGELKEDEFVTFFQSSSGSWRPYGARLPWLKDDKALKQLLAILKKLDLSGADANAIAYIACEPGAGGTTLARVLAWEAARLGYPSLVAKEFPFVPDALPLINFLTRAKATMDSAGSPKEGRFGLKGTGEGERRYEVPWLIVFDSIHWQSREGELIRFQSELKRSGRPACLVVVTGPSLALDYYLNPTFKKVAELNHAIAFDDAALLGNHLNRFLREYGKARAAWQWEAFYKEHTVRYIDGIAAFWVTLSFWIQGHYDLSESIQEWIYRAFKENAKTHPLRLALLRIAALSSERIPLPEVLLPAADNGWPTSQVLADTRASLASLGLIQVASDGTKYWALVHDILGRFLINALFYDFSTREALGFGGASDPEHLRFLLLKQISCEPALGEKPYQSIGEDFATTIFKIDPDHGHGNFVVFWREVLNALDEMPTSLRNTSRLFRHHVAVSRRRIAKLDERFYGVSNPEKIKLANAALEDLSYALNVLVYTAGDETDLNLLNSLANAYFDLAEYEFREGASKERLAGLRILANEATRRAYAESPTSPFVIETYVRNLLQREPDASASAIERCLEALGILFAVLTAGERSSRAPQLGELADQALALLFEQSAADSTQEEPKTAIEVLVRAWRTLAGAQGASGADLAKVPAPAREDALNMLMHPAGRGNMQVLRLRYDLTCLEDPANFRLQLELVQQLEATDYKLSPQLRLEHAILLFQNGRSKEGDKAFFSLRKLWKTGEHFVQVPERLRWLRAANGVALQIVHAVGGSDFENRTLARVEEFNNTLVPFRAEEHGLRQWRVGMRFTCHVSFGHNGPFLRPVTAGPVVDAGEDRG